MTFRSRTVAHVAAFCIAGLLCCRTAGAVTSSERAFLWQDANSAMAASHTPSDFLRAAQTYQQLVDSGVKNAVVFYNLGTALLLAQQYEPAVGALLRAERYGGSGPDITRNLGIALVKVQKGDTPAWPWTRYVLVWHYRLSCATRVLVVALAFSGVWIGFSLRLYNRRSAARAVLAVSLVLLAVFGTSVAATLHEETGARHGFIHTAPPP